MSTKPRRQETMSAPQARRSRKFAAALIAAGALLAAFAPASQAALNLAPAPSFATPYGPKALAVDDWNGDGNQDVAVADYNPADVGDVRVWLGTDSGTFRSSQVVILDGHA